MKKYGIESFIYIPINNENFWCGLDKSGVLRIIKSDEDLGYKAIVTQLKEHKQQFMNYALNHDTGFAYDAPHNAFIFTDWTTTINGKTGLILVSKIKTASEDAYFSNFISCGLPIDKEEIDETDVQHILQYQWLEQSSSIDDTVTEQILFFLDNLLNNGKVIIEIDTNKFDALEIIRRCLYMLPEKYANAVSYNTNAGEKILAGLLDTNVIYATKAKCSSAKEISGIIQASTILNVEQYEPQSGYCKLLKALGRSKAINEVLALNSTSTDTISLAELEVKAKQVLVEKQYEIVVKKVSAINQSCHSRSSSNFENLLSELSQEITTLVKQKGECVAISALSDLGHGWFNTIIKQKNEDVKCFLSTVFNKITDENLFALFSSIYSSSDEFVKCVVVPWSYSKIKGKERACFENWVHRLDTLSKNDTLKYNKAKELCCSLFALFYTDVVSSEGEKVKDSMNSWVFGVGKAFGYCEGTFSTLSNNYERHKLNYAKQQSYLRNFAIEKKGKRSTRNKQRHNEKNDRVEFDAGFNLPLMACICLPAVFVSIVTFLLLYFWAIDLEQIYISLHIVPLSTLWGALFISLAIGLICVVLGLVIRIIHENISSNPPPKVVWLRVLITELVFSLTICLLLLTVNILIII